MGKYLVNASYTSSGVQGLIKEGGSSRLAVVKELTASIGGSIDWMYYAFGEDDVVAVVDLPSDEAAVALALTVGAAGAVNIRTTVLLSPEQIDEAVKLSPAYRAPGG